MDDERTCKQCMKSPAGDDGFCSDECADKYDAQVAGEAEDEEP